MSSASQHDFVRCDPTVVHDRIVVPWSRKCSPVEYFFGSLLYPAVISTKFETKWAAVRVLLLLNGGLGNIWFTWNGWMHFSGNQALNVFWVTQGGEFIENRTSRGWRIIFISFDWTKFAFRVPVWFRSSERAPYRVWYSYGKWLWNPPGFQMPSNCEWDAAVQGKASKQKTCF